MAGGWNYLIDMRRWVAYNGNMADLAEDGSGKMAKVLTPAAIMEIQRLRAEKDEWGAPKYSHLAIADMLGVSETTVFRALHRTGAYRTVQPPKTEEDAKASAARMAKMLEGMTGLPPVAKPGILGEETKPEMTEEAKRRAAEFLEGDD